MNECVDKSYTPSGAICRRALESRPCPGEYECIQRLAAEAERRGLRADASEKREQDLIVSEAKAVQCVTDLRKRVAELEARGFRLSDRECSTCDRRMLAYRGGDTICPECSWRGREEDARRIVATEKDAERLATAGRKVENRAKHYHEHEGTGDYFGLPRALARLQEALRAHEALKERK